MIKTIIRKGSYQDSVVLMLLTNKISAMEGIHKVSIMMATPANKDLFKASGLETPELAEAQSNDMAIVVDVESEVLVEQVLKETEGFLNNQSKSTSGNEENQTVTTWEQALKRLPDANLAVLSIPGMYAAAEADRALDENLNVFIFSDNVSKKDEISLKQKAHEKGLLVMGPDCGTGIIKGVPIAFTNHVRRGKIGVIGASGTGIQEVTTIIDQLGEGVANAIGTGGRDLSAEVGGITMLDAIDAMEKDTEVEVVVILSKPPAKEVRDAIVKRLWDYEKPVVTLFLGEKPEIHEENFYHAYTLDEAARIAVSLVRKEEIVQDTWKPEVGEGFKKEDHKTIKGYYSGGTLAAEAVMLIKDTIGIAGAGGKKEGFMLNTQGYTIIDLGDDVYTVGKPHPMIDPTNRIVCMKQALEEEQTGVILFDLVLGYGSHEDMAGALLPGIRDMMEQVKMQGRKVFFVAAICGTREDKQNYDLQKKKLEDIGVILCTSNKRAVETALCLIGHPYTETEKTILPREKVKSDREHAVSKQMMELLSQKPRVINIGLKSFTDVLDEFSCKAVQYQWTPPAGGDLELIKVLQYLRGYKFSRQ
ncbi:MAG: acyl-CoA synthetase FdrA [Lacrimispora celerecrescens]|nr:acyl-CoA synthetase FdrA [Lacrimispora celerecrescens]